MTRFKFLSELLVVTLCLPGCASMPSWMGGETSENATPISNPFVDYQHNQRQGDQAQGMILRTKKGDRSVELQLPEDPNNSDTYLIPVSPEFKEPNRSISSTNELDQLENLNSYKNHHETISDREITQSFSHGSIEQETQRREIEEKLNLAEAPSTGGDRTSYLAGIDHIKQLYRLARYEAALLETDSMLRAYPTDPKLHEMRGTLLDRLGQRALALKAWNQALHYDSGNQSLRQFIEKKQARSVAGGQP